MNRVEELIVIITNANDAYRNGDAIMSDKDYDLLLEELDTLDPSNELLVKVGVEVIDESRKSRLPITMASMNKLKTFDEVSNWLRLKGIKSDVEIIILERIHSTTYFSKQYYMQFLNIFEIVFYFYILMILLYIFPYQKIHLFF